MIKVIDISSTDRGAYRLLKNRVKDIDAFDGFSNSIICPDGEWRKRIEEDGVRTIPYSFTRGLNVLNIINETKSLVDILKAEKPDIIHIHNSKSGAIGRIAGVLYNFNNKKKVKIIHQVHGYHFTVCTGFKRHVYILVERWLAAFTDILLFQNMYEYNLAQKYSMDEMARLEYIGNGIDLNEIKNAVGDLRGEEIESTTEYFSMQSSNKNLKDSFINERLRDRFKSKKEEEVLLVCVARIEAVKNHMMLMRGIKQLRDKHYVRNIKLVCIGEGEESELNKLKIYIKENGLEENIELIGICKKEEVLALVKKAKVMVLTSKKEGKPRAIMEAMALGVPCVGTNVVGTNETIQDNKTGFLVELDNYKELAEKINELLKNQDLYNRFSRESEIFANNEFNEEKIIAQIAKIYKSVSI
ncbi:glycosyltransferase [Clostridium sp.]|uniref:glycosyltransferase n=1 Tax=Clostridium sp. TaxID=1506 RepID=UPI003F2FF309